jgi:hypothetical protein
MAPTDNGEQAAVPVPLTLAKQGASALLLVSTSHELTWRERSLAYEQAAELNRLIAAATAGRKAVEG